MYLLINLIIVTIYTGNILSEEFNSFNSHDNNNTSAIAPHIVPKNNTKFEIIPVNTTNNYNGSTDAISLKISTKLPNILSKPKIKLYKVKNMTIDQLPIEFPNDLESDLKDQVENIQPVDLTHSEIELEELFRRPIKLLKNTQLIDIDIEVHNTHKRTIHLPILCGTILIVIIAGVLIGYFSWGYYVKKLYGKRHKLLPHDNFNEDSTECI